MRADRDWLQFDCALSYGLVEYLRTLDVMQELGWSSRRVVPHGGHQMSLNIAAGLHLGGNESYPDVFQPFGGFADGIAVEDSRSEEHTSELQSLMRISYAVFCLKKKKTTTDQTSSTTHLNMKHNTLKRTQMNIKNYKN